MSVAFHMDSDITSSNNSSPSPPFPGFSWCGGTFSCPSTQPDSECCREERGGKRRDEGGREGG